MRLKCTIRWCLVYSQSCVTTTTINFRTFSLLCKEIWYPRTNSPLSASQALETTHLFSAHRFAYSGNFIQMEPSITAPVRLACFTSPHVFKVHPCCRQYHDFIPFWWSYNILWWCGQTRSCWAVHPSMGIWMVSISSGCYKSRWYEQPWTSSSVEINSHRWLAVEWLHCGKRVLRETGLQLHFKDMRLGKRPSTTQPGLHDTHAARDALSPPVSTTLPRVTYSRPQDCHLSLPRYDFRFEASAISWLVSADGTPFAKSTLRTCFSAPGQRDFFILNIPVSDFNFRLTTQPIS